MGQCQGLGLEAQSLPSPNLMATRTRKEEISASEMGKVATVRVMQRHEYLTSPLQGWPLTRVANCHESPAEISEPLQSVRPYIKGGGRWQREGLSGLSEVFLQGCLDKNMGWHSALLDGAESDGNTGMTGECVVSPSLANRLLFWQVKLYKLKSCFWISIVDRIVFTLLIN